MEINAHSLIRQQWDKNIHARFPLFDGYFEFVSIRDGIEQITLWSWMIIGDPHDHPEVLFAGSEFLWQKHLRIVDCNKPYEQIMISWISLDIIFVRLREKRYYIIIYRSTDGSMNYHTNLSDPLFDIDLTPQNLSIRNTLTETVVWSQNISPSDATFGSSWEISHSFHIVNHPFSPISQELQLFLSWSCISLKWDPITSLFSEEIHIACSENDFQKLIGFIGSYAILLPEKIDSHFLTYEECSDGSFELPENFRTSEIASFLDPRWQDIQLWILELTFLRSTLRAQLDSLREGIKLTSEHMSHGAIRYQKTILEMTENNLSRMIDILEDKYILYIETIREIISKHTRNET